MNDFYFIYYPIGPTYIKTMMVTFKYIPKDTNVVVMTNTPELLNNVNVDFNLIILDIDTLVDDFSREYEPLIKETDDEKYIKKKLEYKIKFSYAKHRYIIPWLIKRNITKFALLESGCLINFDKKLTNVYEHFKNNFKERNLLFGPVMNVNNKIWDFDVLKPIFDAENIDFNIVKTIESPLTVFDGWLRGFWFNDIKLLEKYFNIWDNIVKQTYKNNLPYFDLDFRFIYDEHLIGIINETFKRQYDVLVDDIIIDGGRIVKHIYHPENEYSSLHHPLYHSFGLETANSRQEFFEKNKINLIKFYGTNHGFDEKTMSEIIYDYPKN